MFMLWLPGQILGFFLLAGVFYYLDLKKETITRFIDKMR